MKRSNSIASRPMYRKFKKKLPKGLDYKQYSSIIHEYHKIIADVVLNDPKGFNFSRLEGKISVVRNKPKRQPIDWVATKRSGKLTRYSNDHSFGYVYKHVWQDKKFKMKHFWKFISSRHNNKRLKDVAVTNKYYFSGTSW